MLKIHISMTHGFYIMIYLFSILDMIMQIIE